MSGAPAAGTMHGVVVLATYNEAGSIGAVLAEINEAAIVLARSGIALSVLIVDDHSPDDTVRERNRGSFAASLSLPLATAAAAVICGHEICHLQ